MKTIKRLLTIGFVVVFMLCMSISLFGCTSYYCDPKGKEWHNAILLPNIDEPFNEIYDGSYSIQIDKDGNVLFKPLNGEAMKGRIHTSKNDKSALTDISIQFENEKTATGKCYKSNSGRTLQISYDHRSYIFSERRQLSKEEFDEYRSRFIEFLTSVYETGYFPTKQELANNSLYQQFTNYHQIDPCCGGPIVYTTVERGTIEKIEAAKPYGKEITVRINGESIVCQTEDELGVIRIKNGEMTELSESDITEGDCLVSRSAFWNGTEGIEEYQISKIFYFAEAAETVDRSIISLSPEIESQFDLTDEKIWWNSNTNIDFADDKIIIIFKKTTMYPELLIEDFDYENAESIKYLFLRPTGGQYENAENYRQIAVIHLKEKGRDRVIEAVLYFERISIILCAEPNYLYSIEEC